ncbi:MAG: hypothetical protein V1779_11640 [bacterium]
MYQAQININESVHKRLLDLSHKLQKKESEIISLALLNYNPDNNPVDRISLLRQAKGIWKDRTDLQTPEELRQSWERFD